MPVGVECGALGCYSPSFNMCLIQSLREMGLWPKGVFGVSRWGLLQESISELALPTRLSLSLSLLEFLSILYHHIR